MSEFSSPSLERRMSADIFREGVGPDDFEHPDIYLKVSALYTEIKNAQGGSERILKNRNVRGH